MRSNMVAHLANQDFGFPTEFNFARNRLRWIEFGGELSGKICDEKSYFSTRQYIRQLSMGGEELGKRFEVRDYFISSGVK